MKSFWRYLYQLLHLLFKSNQQKHPKTVRAKPNTSHRKPLFGTACVGVSKGSAAAGGGPLVDQAVDRGTIFKKRKKATHQAQI